MVKMLEVREMVKLVDQSSLERLEVKNGGLRVLIKKSEIFPAFPISKSSAPIVQPEKNIKNGHPESDCNSEGPSQPYVLQSLTVGTFQSLVKVREKVEIGTLIGYCEVTQLNLQHEIISDQNGIINEVLVDDGQLIDYGQPLFKISVGKE